MYKCCIVKLLKTLLIYVKTSKGSLIIVTVPGGGVPPVDPFIASLAEGGRGRAWKEARFEGVTGDLKKYIVKKSKPKIINKIGDTESVMYEVIKIHLFLGVSFNTSPLILPF